MLFNVYGRASYSVYGLGASILKHPPKKKIKTIKNSIKTLRSYMHVIIIVVITLNDLLILKKKNTLNNMQTISIAYK